MDRIEELLQYMQQLTQIAEEYPQIDFTKRVERVCDEIEKELNIKKSCVGELKVKIDAAGLVENLTKEIEKYK